ncbi:hypothetical protein [Gemmata sp. SH-PL17]|uniref:hypothetical protein n=1 Tax=Gemmata sp. SH-PL17 TaxID=1630693 RepID=UPI0012F86877|nr:hypothetical protein [Gemmata sp. SH-PL17]
MRSVIVLLAFVVSSAGCLHTNSALAPKTSPAPESTLPQPSGPLTLVPDGTCLHPAMPFNLAFALDLPSDQRPSEAEVALALVDPTTGAAVRTARRSVTFDSKGRTKELKDVFDSSQFGGKQGRPLPNGVFVLVAQLRVGGADLEARQRIEVLMGDWCGTRGRWSQFAFWQW